MMNGLRSWVAMLLMAIAVQDVMAANAAERVAEEQGVEAWASSAPGAARILSQPPATGLLLIPDSGQTRVMAFDAVTGDLLDENYIPPDPVHLRTPIEILPSPDGDSFLISDQLEDVVRQYDLEGNYLSIFAPASGVDNGILDNMRGMDFDASGNLLVTVGSGGNAHAVAEFDAAGQYLGTRINATSDGLNSPFDILVTEDALLVTGAGTGTGNAQLHRFDTQGSPLGALADIDAFPEQIATTASGGLLVANFSGAQAGIVELDADGNRIAVHAPAGLSRFRGVHELPDGHLLVATDNGVHELDRNGNLVETKISGVSARYITFFNPVSLTSPTVTSPTPVPLLQPAGILLLGIFVGMVARRRGIAK